MKCKGNIIDFKHARAVRLCKQYRKRYPILSNYWYTKWKQHVTKQDGDEDA